MSKSRKPGAAGAVRNRTPLPYTEQKRHFFEFTTAKRIVRSGGQTKKMSNLELVTHRQLEAALAGNSIAQRDHIRHAEEAIQSREHHVKTQCEMWSAYKELAQQAIDLARARNEPPPEDLPHPADIQIDWTNGVTILGPMDEQGRKRCDGLAKFRDALFVQQIMEDADNRVAMDERPSKGAALVHGMLTNKRLPPSLRMTDLEIDIRIFFLLRLSKRGALLRAREAWKEAGCRMPRAQHYGTLEKLEGMITAEANYLNALHRGEDDPEILDELVEALVHAVQAFGASAPKRKRQTTPAAQIEEQLA